MAVRFDLRFSEDVDRRPMEVSFTARAPQDAIVDRVTEDDDGTPVVVTYAGRRLRLVMIRAREEH